MFFQMYVLLFNVVQTQSALLRNILVLANANLAMQEMLRN